MTSDAVAIASAINSSKAWASKKVMVKGQVDEREKRLETSLRKKTSP